MKASKSERFQSCPPLKEEMTVRLLMLQWVILAEPHVFCVTPSDVNRWALLWRGWMSSYLFIAALLLEGEKKTGCKPSCLFMCLSFSFCCSLPPWAFCHENLRSHEVVSPGCAVQITFPALHGFTAMQEVPGERCWFKREKHFSRALHVFSLLDFLVRSHSFHCWNIYLQ